MKTFLWLLTFALIVVCLTGWVMSELIEHSLRDLGDRIIIPYFTGLIVLPHGWVLFVPLPWAVAAAVLTCRRQVTPSSVLLFAGTLIVAAALLVCVLALAFMLPYLPRRP